MTLVFGLFLIGTLLREICIFASGCVTVTTSITPDPTIVVWDSNYVSVSLSGEECRCSSNNNSNIAPFCQSRNVS
jgi:hypothetical protein